MTARAEWILSVTETQQLRNAPDALPDANLYRKADLVALTYVDPKKYWHLLLSVHNCARPPELEELREAFRLLVPILRELTIEAGYIADRHGAVPCFHAHGPEATRQ